MDLTHRLSKRQQRPIGWIVLFAVLVRLKFASDIHVPVIADAASYVKIAKNLLEHGFFGQDDHPDLSRPPLLPVVIWAAVKFLQAPLDYWTYVAINLVCDALSVFVLCILGQRINAKLALPGIAFVAISPLWLAHVNSPITESITLTLILLFLERWTRAERTERDLLWAGAWLGLATLARSMFLWFGVCLIAWEQLFRGAPRGFRLELKHSWRFLVPSFIPPLIWGIRNLVTMGEFNMSQTGWTAILMSWNVIKLPLLEWRIPEHNAFMVNHPYADVILGHPGSVSRQLEVETLMKREVLEFIRDHPWTYLWNLFPKTARLWFTGWYNPYPYVFAPDELKSSYLWVFAMPVLALGVLGLALHWKVPRMLPAPEDAAARWRATRAQAALIIYITAVTLPFSVDARYALPAYVLFALWLGAGLFWLVPDKR